MNEQKTNDLILQTATKLVSFIILLFSFYLFLSGHNAPGGGFVGGLITSSSIVLLLLAYDLKTVRSLLPVNFIYVAGAGLLLAVLTGVGSFVFGGSFFNPHIRILSAADPWENGARHSDDI